MTRALLADRRLRLIVLAQTLSMLGDSVMLLALGIWVKDLTGSNAAAGAVILVVVLPTLAAPLAGYVVDRVPRRRFLIIVELGSALMLLPLLVVHDERHVVIVYGVAFLYGLSFALISPAMSALIATTVPSDDLADVNGVVQTIKEAMRLGGPLLGAVLYSAFGGGTVAMFDAGTFVLAAICLTRLTAEDAIPTPMPSRFRTEVAAGLRHLQRTVVLRRTVGATAVACLVIGFCETVLFAVVDDGLHRSPAFLGVLSSAQGVGSVTGGLTAARLIRRFAEQEALAIGLLAIGIGCAAWASSELVVVVAGMILFGAGVPWAVVALRTLAQRRTPTHLQGRVASATDMLLGTPQTLSIGLGAIAVSAIDYRILVVVMAVVLAASAAYLHVRHDDPATAPPTVDDTGDVTLLPTR